MSLKFIYSFQVRIYKLLAGTTDIAANIDKIYLSPVQDAAYPFLLINIIKIKNLSNLNQDIYEVDLEICAFARDKNQGLLINLAASITEVLTISNCHFNEYIIAGLNLYSATFTQGHDLVTTKLAITYKAILKKEV